MSVDFGSLIIDLETLVGNSKEDFSNEFWSEYETYLKTYNNILKDLQSLGFYKKMKPVEPVPFSDQSFESGVSKQEQAKLREITNASDNLLRKVKLLLSPPKSYTVNNQVRSNQIFVVNGNDNELKQEVIQTLEKLEVEPINLTEEANSKNKLITKVSEHPNVSFAVVLVSPDDIAHSKEKTADESSYQATQNVIFELGYFLGKLGKQNVVAIYPPQKNFNIPTEYEGILWIEHKVGWYFKLINELKACNFDVDANKLGWY